MIIRPIQKIRGPAGLKRAGTFLLLLSNVVTLVPLISIQMLVLDSAALAEVTSPEPAVVRVNQGQDNKSKVKAKVTDLYRGWHHLVGKLTLEGISEVKLRKTYGSTRIPRFTPIYFGLNPIESPSIYKKTASSNRVKLAKECMSRYLTYFNAAEKRYKVPREVIASIIMIETQCGRVTGREQVLYRLSRLASVGDPINLELNLKRLRKSDKTVNMTQVESRAAYLQKTFLPEVKALFDIAESKRINIFNVRGSSAGAFGISQFLPSSYISFGVDGNRDNKVSLFSPGDAIWSTANYLASHGWNIKKSFRENKDVIWHYNRSSAYGDAVIWLAEKL